MKSFSVFLFSTYFFLCLTFFFLVRLFFLEPLKQESYKEIYPPQSDFVSLELSSGRHIPFLRLHNNYQTLWGDWNWEISKNSVEESPNISEDVEEIYLQNIYDIYVFPEEYYAALSRRDLIESIDIFLRPAFIQKHVDQLTLLLFWNDFETRGRMREKKIYLYSLERLQDNEIFSVFVHEFWHYYDIYGLPRSRFGDLSEKFYEISWEEVDILKAGQEVHNFVSGYAMTNKYEDFAESYTYYILHNSAFLERSFQNPVLAQKYAFFEQYTFPQKEFYKRSFAVDARILPYYWDITKIEIEREKFLQYINLYL